MDLLQQTEKWTKQKKWDKIIRAIEKVKPKDLSGDLMLTLVTAYLNKAEGWQDRKIAKKALDILYKLQYPLEDNLLFYLLIGKALTILDRKVEASQYYEEGANSVESDEHTRMLFNLFESSREHLDPFSFTEPFSVRVCNAWKEFEKREAEFRNILDKDVEGKRAGELRSKAIAVFENAVDNVYVVLNKKDDKYELVFTAGSNPLILFAELYLKEQAPTSVLENWKISVGAPLVPYDTPETESSPHPLQDLQVWFTELDYGLFRAEGYSKTLWKPSGNDINEMMNSGFFRAYLLGLVGEAAYSKYVEEAKVIHKPAVGEPISARDVPNFFESDGIDIHAGTKAILEKMVPYKDVDMGLEENEFRRDVMFGATMAPKTLYAYRDWEPHIFNDLEADGAIVCTLYFDNGTFTGEDREEKIQKYRLSVEKELLEKTGSESLKIIGYAHGKLCEYIDMIAWNPRKVFDTATEIAKGSPVNRMKLHVSGIYAFQYDLKKASIPPESSLSTGNLTPEASLAISKDEQDKN